MIPYINPFKELRLYCSKKRMPVTPGSRITSFSSWTWRLHKKPDRCSACPCWMNLPMGLLPLCGHLLPPASSAGSRVRAGRLNGGRLWSEFVCGLPILDTLGPPAQACRLLPTDDHPPPSLPGPSRERPLSAGTQPKRRWYSCRSRRAYKRASAALAALLSLGFGV